MATLQTELRRRNVLGNGSYAEQPLHASIPKRRYLQEALGGDAAGLVVLSVAQPLLLLPIPPAQGWIVPEALHSGGERLVDGHRRLGAQARISHPEFHLCSSPSGPQPGLARCRHGQRVWALGFLYRKQNF